MIIPENVVEGRKHFGRVLSRLRKEAGFSQRAFARGLEFSRNNYVRWEEGIYSPSKQQLEQILQLLDADSDEREYLTGAWGRIPSWNYQQRSMRRAA